MGFFDKLFNRSKTDNSTPFVLDNISEGELLGFLRYESTFRYQEYKFPRYHEDKNPATLESVLIQIMDKFIGHVVSMTMISTGEAGKTMEVKHENDRLAILNTRLFPLVRTKIEEGVYMPRRGQNVTFILKFSEEAPQREAVVFLRGIPGGVTGYTYCMRVSIMIPVVSAEDNLHTGKAWTIGKHTTECNCCPVQASFVIFEDYNDMTGLMKEYERVTKIASPKYKAGELRFEPNEAELIRGVFEQYSNVAYISIADELMEQGRWLDAYNHLRRSYANLSGSLLSIPKEKRGGVYDLAYRIGVCLMNLERYDEAAYFLWVSHNNDDMGIENLMKVFANLCDLTIPEQLRTESFLDIREDARIKLQFATAQPYSSNISLGYIFSELFNAKPGNLCSLAIMKSGETEPSTFITEGDKVWSYSVRPLLEDGTTVIVSYSPVFISSDTIKDASSLTLESSFIIKINTANESEGLMRLNIMLPNFPYDDDKSSAILETNVPDGISIIMSKETMRFHRIGKDPMAAIEVAISLRQEGRFIEALHVARYGYNSILARWETASELEKETLYQAAYEVGFCLMDFKLQSRANYYLRFAASSRYSNFIIEYVNSLANLNDMHTFEIIEAYEKIPSDGTDLEDYNGFMRFLKRRKAFSYIEAKMYDAAEAILKEMSSSNDERDREFAINELEYLNNLRSEEQK